MQVTTTIFFQVQDRHESLDISAYRYPNQRGTTLLSSGNYYKQIMKRWNNWKLQEQVFWWIERLQELNFGTEHLTWNRNHLVYALLKQDCPKGCRNSRNGEDENIKGDIVYDSWWTGSNPDWYFLWTIFSLEYLYWKPTGYNNEVRLPSTSECWSGFSRKMTPQHKRKPLKIPTREKASWWQDISETRTEEDFGQVVSITAAKGHDLTVQR